MPEFRLAQEDERLFSLEITEIETANGTEKLSLWMSDAEAMQLWEAVEAGIGAHVQDMRAAKWEFDAGRARFRDEIEPDDGYDPDDPKSPGFYERAVEAWDSRPGK
jgi:hypothetical protein